MNKKLVAYFSASGVTGRAAKTLAPCCPGAVVGGGKMLNGRLDAGALKAWADSL